MAHYFFRSTPLVAIATAAIIIMLGLLTGSASAQIETKHDFNAEILLAASGGNGMEVQRLVASGADPNSLNREGIPALALAALRTDAIAPETIQALIDSGAKVDLTDSRGQSALFYAARGGSKDNAELLMNNGAQYYLKDNRGFTPRDIANQEHHPEMVKVIDDFISGKTNEMMQRYENRNEKITAMNELNKQIADAKARAQTAAATAATKTEQAAKPPPAPPAPPIDKAKLQEELQNLSYHACLAAYWDYLREVKMTTPFEGRKLKEEINRETREAFAMEDALRKDFLATDKYIASVRGPTESKIRAQLNSYPTNTHRKSDGVGTVEDAEDRCNQIGDSWKLVTGKAGKQRGERKDRKEGKERKGKTKDKKQKTVYQAPAAAASPRASINNNAAQSSPKGHDYNIEQPKGINPPVTGAVAPMPNSPSTSAPRHP